MTISNNNTTPPPPPPSRCYLIIIIIIIIISNISVHSIQGRGTGGDSGTDYPGPKVEGAR